MTLNAKPPTPTRYLQRLFMAFILMTAVCGQVLGQVSTKGRLSGKVIDSETGEAILGANVFVRGTTIGAASDLNGHYLINIDPGVYAVIVSVVGFTKQTISDVEVKAGAATEVNVVLHPEAIETEEVVITARLIQNSEATNLIARQRSLAVSDAVSLELMSRSGSSTAADAMTRVTGASVVGGRYVYIRGLGERYTSTQLNGMELASVDPDKRTFQMDLLPSTMLENIVTVKSFTPDKPGNFSGGIVDISTRSYPDGFSVRLSSSGSFNTLSSLKNNFMTYHGGSTDWLALDDGTRSIPSLLSDPNLVIPDATTARTNTEDAEFLDKVSKSFTSTQMAPMKGKSPMNQKYSLYVGNQFDILGSQLGVLGSLCYGREFSLYQNGKIGRWKLTGSVNTNDELTNLITMDDTKGVSEASWGSLIAATLKPSPNHEISTNLVLTRTGESTARYMVGEWPEQLSGNALFETRVLQFTQRDLLNYQVKGKHVVGLLGPTTIEWSGSRSKSRQDEPDTRFFSNTFSHTVVGGRDTTVYSISPSIFPRPARYFRRLDENTSGLTFDISQPIEFLTGSNSKLKIGALFQEKSRAFRERRFEYRQAPGTVYAGNSDSFFSEANSGIIGYDSARGRYVFGNYLANAPDARGGNYDGYERILAFYGMVEIPVLSRFRLVAGIRFEQATMNVSGRDTVGRLADKDLLPSVNVTYQLTPSMNLRASYGRTLARPNFREKAPYASYSFANDFVFLGNINLQRTLINNYDLRWEWFVRPGEILAVSAFHKDMKNPIERVINVLYTSEGGEVLYENVDAASIHGMEFEIRTRLDVLHHSLREFSFGGNLSVITSRVNIPDGELQVIRDVDPSTPSTRQLQGQSPYLLNLNLSYDNISTGTSASLFYNVIGDRLAEISLGGTPDIFERSRPLLDLSLSQRLFERLTLSLGAKNLLDSKFLLLHTYKGRDFVRTEYRTGISLSFAMAYAIN